MPPLLCPSPIVLDQTFPRSVAELRLVGRALGNIQLLLEEERCRVLLTEVLRGFIVQMVGGPFDWSRVAEYPKLQAIYAVLAQFGLQQHGVQTVDVSQISEYQQHPLPADSTAAEFGPIWSDEIGRLLVLHSRHCSLGKFFIGVACTHAFAGEVKDKFENPDGLPTFPLVGPGDLGGLEDSLAWELPADLHQREVTFADAYKRISILGGEVRSPSGSSHYQVRFKCGRTWPLDRNLDRIPHRFLKELEPITGQGIDVIKYVLLFGEWPRRSPRIPTRGR